MLNDLRKVVFNKTYRGCTIEKVDNGYKVFGQVYLTLYLAKKRVDLAFMKLRNIKIYS